MSDQLTRADVLRIVQEARDEGIRPDLRGANLRGAELRGASLRGADLRGSDLSGADLRGSDLSGANLRWSNLSGADLRGSDLSGADLSGADLQGANLWKANLQGANLRGVAWGGLRIDGLPSGRLTLTPTLDGWHVRIGCWRGTPEGLARLLDAPDEEWPEARGAERTRREALLRPALALIAAHTAAHPDVIPALAKKWSTK